MPVLGRGEVEVKSTFQIRMCGVDCTFCTILCRFTEILQCAEGLTEDQVKAAIRKSRIMFNRCAPM